MVVDAEACGVVVLTNTVDASDVIVTAGCVVDSDCTAVEDSVELSINVVVVDAAVSEDVAILLGIVDESGDEIELELLNGLVDAAVIGPVEVSAVLGDVIVFVDGNDVVGWVIGEDSIVVIEDAMGLETDCSVVAASVVVDTDPGEDIDLVVT